MFWTSALPQKTDNKIREKTKQWSNRKRCDNGEGRTITDHGNDKDKHVEGWGRQGLQGRAYRKTEGSTFLFVPCSLENSSWDRCAYWCAQAAYCLPVSFQWVFVLYAELAHCLEAGCMLAEALLCVITMETKTHRSEFCYMDINRHVNAPLESVRGAYGNVLDSTYRVDKVCVTHFKGICVVCVLFKEHQETEGSCLGATHCSAACPPQVPPHTHTRTHTVS